MGWLANKKQKPAVLSEPIRAELQRITGNLVEEIRAQYAQMSGAVDASVTSLENIRGVLISAAEKIAKIEAHVNDLESRIQKLEQAQRQG